MNMKNIDEPTSAQWQYRSQIQNIANQLFPKQTLLEGQLQLALAHLPAERLAVP